MKRKYLQPKIEVLDMASRIPCLLLGGSDWYDKQDSDKNPSTSVFDDDEEGLDGGNSW